MNKKDISAIKKEFKPDNLLLNIKQIYNVYLKCDNKEIVHTENNMFDRLGETEQELYYKNFKKLLTGTLDSKVFELEFINSGNNDNQTMLHNILKTQKSDDFKANADKVVEKIAGNFNWETDIVINFIKAEYLKPIEYNKDDESGNDDNVYKFDFIMCSLNKIDMAKKALKFDHKTQTFKATSGFDTIINISSPLDGFMYPTFNDNSADANKVIYYTSKADRKNENFVENILSCVNTLTAREEKEKFENILSSLVKEKMSPDTMQQVYEQINNKMEYNDANDNSEPLKLGIPDIEKVLVESGIKDTEDLSKIFNDIAGSSYKFKASNIIPNYHSKSININSDKANISISPKDLGSIKQVLDKRGRKCLLIEIDDSVIINGIALTTERL
ncbi:MAG: hypothetical protein K0R54_713 [Clostridiaceae bacterium]|jgi:hypothetical protein|nr:hypothetical protein [Clostridiaceae bacterium]